jgi:hypothetical protein
MAQTLNSSNVDHQQVRERYRSERDKLIKLAQAGAPEHDLCIMLCTGPRLINTGRGPAYRLSARRLIGGCARWRCGLTPYFASNKRLRSILADVRE